jgi:hypothetical protein
MQKHPKHDEDFYGWAMAQATLLRQGRFNQLDIKNLIEELECMGASEKRELINRLSLIITHLLKWQLQPNMRGHSWKYTIREQRDQAKIHLEDNPSLKHKINEIILKAYKLSISKAVRETGLDEKYFPTECPYTFDQLLNEEFFPD